MRPYGLRIEEWPDIEDIKLMAAKGSAGRIRKRSGDYYPYSRGPLKARLRRYWKRQARREGQCQCKDLED